MLHDHFSASSLRDIKLVFMWAFSWSDMKSLSVEQTVNAGNSLVSLLFFLELWFSLRAIILPVASNYCAPTLPK